MMKNRFKTFCFSAAFLASAIAAHADGITLKESGSTLILPVFEKWSHDYASGHDGVSITTAGTGSEKGIAAAIDGLSQIGTSDAFISGAQEDANPQLLNIAMAIAAQTVNYNLPGLSQPLKLDGPVLAAIYTGKITSWDDPAIAKLNQGVTLPNHAIVPVHRADGSGDTFVFTQYLSFTTEEDDGPSFQTGSDGGTGFLTQPSSWSKAPGFGTTIQWPEVGGAQSATGNAGMVETLGKTPFSIGYVGVSFADKVKAAGLGTAMMRSNSGQFLLPTPETIAAAAASLTPRTPPDQRLSLINAPGDNSYPLINYEYAIVSANQPDAATATALRRFLLWATAPDEANEKVLASDNFIPLPAHIWAMTHDQIEKIH